MKTTNDTGRICLEVFGMISASVSHEVKNCLAIINETAGLLDDFALMLGDEGAVPVAKTKPAAASIMKQVERTNLLMKQFSTFAHSTDQPAGSAELRETAELMIQLSARQAAAKKLEVQLTSSTKDVSVTTNIAALESLIYLALRQVYSWAQTNDTITVETADKGQLHITFEAEAPAAGPAETDTRCSSLAGFLGGNYEVHPGRVSISFPWSREKG